MMQEQQQVPPFNAEFVVIPRQMPDFLSEIHQLLTLSTRQASAPLVTKRGGRTRNLSELLAMLKGDGIKPEIISFETTEDERLEEGRFSRHRTTIQSPIVTVMYDDTNGVYLVRLTDRMYRRHPINPSVIAPIAWNHRSPYVGITEGTIGVIDEKDGERREAPGFYVRGFDSLGRLMSGEDDISDLERLSEHRAVRITEALESTTEVMKPIYSGSLTYEKSGTIREFEAIVLEGITCMIFRYLVATSPQVGSIGIVPENTLRTPVSNKRKGTVYEHMETLPPYIDALKQTWDAKRREIKTTPTGQQPLFVPGQNMDAFAVVKYV